LFLVLRESKPNTAKAAGIGALAGEITKVLLFILLIVIQITSVRMSMMP
jgi:F0F1-type ATP synthase assembly protein I